MTRRYPIHTLTLALAPGGGQAIRFVPVGRARRG